VTDIFLSYNREDQARAKLFAEAFEAQGFKVWWDVGLRTGEAYDEVTETALRTAKAVVVLWSKKSVQSRWVRAEATLADRNKTLVPCMIEPCERPIMFELTQTAELSDWTGATDDKAFAAFLGDVARFVGKDLASARAPASTAVDPKKPLLLVLPFVNRSGEAEQDYFSDGVTEDIMSDLACVSELSLVSRTTAFALKGKVATSAELAASLRITHLLEGSVRKQGERIRITAQLTDAKTDTALWSERFDRTLNDIFAIQDDIARAIVAALKVRLAPEERAAIERRSGHDGQAYRLTLLARQFRSTRNERQLALVKRISKRAIELDPSAAEPWALLAYAEWAKRKGPADGLEAAETALRLDPTLPFAWAAMSFVRIAQRDLVAARDAAEQAVRLGPSTPEAFYNLGMAAAGQHDWSVASDAFARALELAPHDFSASGMLSYVLQSMGDEEDAHVQRLRTFALCERAIEADPENASAFGFGVGCLCRFGEIERAREWTERALLIDPDNVDQRYNMACGFAQVGDMEGVITCLEPVIQRMGPGLLGWMDKDTDFDAVRTDPRFIALRAKGDGQ
jgi:adenylate cyclase